MELFRLKENIASLRRRDKMTQEELADYMGVSKSSVSKWETGTTIPDIVFLPELANLFHVTLDELLGYEPQLDRDQIRRIYDELSKEMSSGDRNQALKDYKDYVHRYSCCFPFLNQMCVLLLNHLDMYEETQRKELYDLLWKQCQRIKEKSEDADLMKDAIMMESILSIQIKQPEKVLELIGEDIRPLRQDSELIASAYQMLGNIEKAKEITQVCSYQYLLFFLQDTMNYMMMNVENHALCDEIIQRLHVVMHTFHLDRLHAITAITFHLDCAVIYAMREDKDATLTSLETYTDICCYHNETLEHLKGDEFFCHIDQWLQDLELGTRAPRAKQMVYASLLQAIEENPLFQFLHEEHRYQTCVERLKHKL